MTWEPHDLALRGPRSLHTLKREEPLKWKPGHLHPECRFHCQSESCSCFAPTSVTISLADCLHALHYVSVGWGRAVAKRFSFSLHSGEPWELTSLTDRQACLHFPRNKRVTCGLLRYTLHIAVNKGMQLGPQLIKFSSHVQGKAKQSRQDSRRDEVKGLVCECAGLHYSFGDQWDCIACFK